MFKIPEASRGLVKSFAQACLRHFRTRFWSISHNGFFLPELSATLLWVCLDFQRPWHFSSHELKKIFQKSYVYKRWLTIHYSLDSDCWLFQPSGSWVSNKASTVRSLAFSGVCFGKISFVILQTFSFKHSRSINLVNSQFFWYFLSSWLDHCPLPNWQAASSSPWWDSLQAVHVQVVFLWPLSCPSSEEPRKL